MKNRIWKKILAVGVSLLAEAGMLVGCTAQPAVAYGAEMEGGLSVAQDAAWTDLQKFQAVISVKADGLASLTWENENQEYESDDENLFSSGNQDGSLENDQYDFSRALPNASLWFRIKSASFNIARYIMCQEPVTSKFKEEMENITSRNL